MANQSEFCWGFFLGVSVAGIVGLILNQIRLAYIRFGAVARPQKVVAETKKSPAQVVGGSIEAGVWLVVLILTLMAVTWVLFEAVG